MSTYREKLWSRFDELAKGIGLEIFDIETPSGSDESAHAGFLKVFIMKARKSNESAAAKTSLTVDVSDCSRLSRLILDLPDVEELLPGDCQLEVSSPGINRKLSRSEHFDQAVGERLRLVVRKETDSKDNEVLRGKLLSFNGSQLEIEEEMKKSRQLVDYNKVAEARVDFKF